MKITSVEAELFHAEGRAGGRAGGRAERQAWRSCNSRENNKISGLTKGENFSTS